VRLDEDLHDALELMVTRGMREIPVVDERDQIVGFLDEADITRVYLQQTASTGVDSSRTGTDA
jgi:CBS domain-containing protein